MSRRFKVKQIDAFEVNHQSPIIYNELDLEKRIIIKQDITKNYQIKSYSNPVITKSINQMKQEYEGIKKKMISLNEYRNKPNIIENNNNNILGIFSERTYNHKGRITKGNENNNIQNQKQNNYQNQNQKEGSQLIISKNNHLDYHNTQLSIQDSQSRFNQQMKSFDIRINNQVQQNLIDMYPNHSSQPKRIFQLSDGSKSHDQLQNKKIDFNSQNFGRTRQLFQINEQQTKQGILENRLQYNLKSKTETLQEMKNKLKVTRQVLNFNQHSDEIFDTLLQTQHQKCFHCILPLNHNSFQLGCLHNYHLECLMEIITHNIKSGNTLFYCICKTKIPQKIILKLFESQKELTDILFKNQIQHLIKLIQQNTGNTRIDQNVNFKIEKKSIIVRK